MEWLKNIMDRVINDKPQYEQIYKAFRFMYRFEFNTRAQLIQEVRKQLYIINPICDREYAKPLYDFHRDNAGKEVNFYLTSRMSIIEENLRHVLVDLYHAPNQAFYAAAEEFYDRLTFANSLNESEFESMQDVWGKFFMEYSSQLWTASSEKYQQANELVREYQNIKRSWRWRITYGDNKYIDAGRKTVWEDDGAVRHVPGDREDSGRHRAELVGGKRSDQKGAGTGQLRLFSRISENLRLR